MTTREAKEILLLFRPGRGDEADPQIATALEVVEGDADLQAWFREHCAFAEAVRKKLNELPVPRTLKGDILLGPKVVHGPAHWWSRRAALAAAGFVFFAVVASVWWTSRPTSMFDDYRARMVGTILREYRMDIVTNDMQAVRSFLVNKGAPADYVVPSNLSATSLTGAGALSWRGQPVSMVCFDRGQQDMVFLFVSLKHNVDDPPSAPQLALVSELATASWTSGDKIYLIAASGEPEKLRSYLPPAAADP